MTARKSISGKTRNTVADRQLWKCVYKRLGEISECGKDLRVVGFDVDHIQALVHSGENSVDNYRAICVPCHKHKTALDIKANAKVKRILGLTKQRPKKKILGRGFDKSLRRKMDGSVVPRQ